MTILVVAILHGKTEEEWYQWIKSRVEQNIGYTTPLALPTIYSETRRANYARREAAKVQEKAQQEQWKKEHPEEFARSGYPRPNPPGAFERGGIFDDILREMQAAGDIRILSQEDDDDDDDEFEVNITEDTETTTMYSFSGEDGARIVEQDEDGDAKMMDVTRSLKQQVDELVRGESSAGMHAYSHLQGEAPRNRNVRPTETYPSSN